MSHGKTKFRYTWVASRENCTAELHETGRVCENCDTDQVCEGCGDTIPAGKKFRYCTDNGEVVCKKECQKRASEKWGDDYC
ncbi:hypothetical protein OOJ91_13625 [Micromonospora lupini]|uniref:hypothetical protein n=1 Tax=Micromonospora lupini TaxID=285679 RepID=UPI002258B9A1|nr:hypothetical protein [Micromonospora lupini]MCX5066886.1 hypothetical protein [Micromonospora lupini]